MGAATFGWLCVETTELDNALNALREQPPSGGCVLKLLKAVVQTSTL